MSDIELFTSDELIGELARRVTFMGIIIRPTKGMSETNAHNRFEITVKGMQIDDAIKVLGNAMNSLGEG